jgi:DNA-binding NarL/FixJ family response regulator
MDSEHRSLAPLAGGDDCDHDAHRRRAKAPRVLVVEDQALIALALAADLAALDCEVIGRAATGEAALELARRHAPDIVLMDVHLAGRMDGIQAAALIKAVCAPRIIFVTAYADGADRARMEALRPAAILGKPYHPSELNLAIHVSARQRLRRQPYAAAAAAGD